MLSVSMEPVASGTTSWRAIVLIPGPVASQVKVRPATTSVTSHTACGSLGWRTLARDPTWNGPSSRRSTLSIVGVHWGHRVTSKSTPQTRCGGASMCLVVSKNLGMYQTVHLVGDAVCPRSEHVVSTGPVPGRTQALTSAGLRDPTFGGEHEDTPTRVAREIHAFGGPQRLNVK